jgi:3-isopropylmalate/(R)-2-methylmalate dehydratase small subunit
MRFSGKAWVFGANVNTDLIFPKTWFRPSYEPGEMASHLMVGIDPEFPKKVGRGDLIVGGGNFGCGSSREEAAGAMKEAGIQAVIAPSFARLFSRNSINAGLPALICQDIDRHVENGDMLDIDLEAGTLRNQRNGFTTQLPKIAPELLRLIDDGGIAAYTRRILAERKQSAGKQ